MQTGGVVEEPGRGPHMTQELSDAQDKGEERDKHQQEHRHTVASGMWDSGQGHILPAHARSLPMLSQVCESLQQSRALAQVLVIGKNDPVFHQNLNNNHPQHPTPLMYTKQCNYGQKEEEAKPVDHRCIAHFIRSQYVENHTTILGPISVPCQPNQSAASPQDRTRASW